MGWLASVAGIVTAAGAGLLFLAWSRRDLRRLALPGGWAVTALGLGLWAAVMRADTGLAFGVVILMTAALGIVTAQGVRTLRATKPARAARLREDEADGLDLGRGYWGRVAMRTFASLVAVPVAAALAGLLLYRFMTGEAADRLMAGALVATLALSGLLVWLLASARPWRTGVIISILAVSLTAAAWLSRSV